MSWVRARALVHYILKRVYRNDDENGRSNSDTKVAKRNELNDEKIYIERKSFSRQFSTSFQTNKRFPSFILSFLFHFLLSLSLSIPSSFGNTHWIFRAAVSVDETRQRIHSAFCVLFLRFHFDGTSKMASHMMDTEEQNRNERWRRRKKTIRIFISSHRVRFLCEWMRTELSLSKSVGLTSNCFFVFFSLSVFYSRFIRSIPSH